MEGAFPEFFMFIQSLARMVRDRIVMVSQGWRQPPSSGRTALPCREIARKGALIPTGGLGMAWLAAYLLSNLGMGCRRRGPVAS